MATTGFVALFRYLAAVPSQLSCSFTPSTARPTAGAPQAVTVTITASQSASLPPAGKPWNAALLLLSVFLSLLILAALSNPSKMRTKPVAVGLIISLCMLAISCGGGNSAVPPVIPTGGSNSYTLAVIATAAGTSTTRNLGSINVTVTH